MPRRTGRIATLLLGLYDDAGELRYVGTAAVAPAKHDQIAELVLPLRADAPERRFSEPNRWGSGELEQAPVRPELVVEVRYDKWQRMRFRHGTRLLRFRPDKEPEQCTVAQVRPRPKSRRPDRLGAARSLIRTRRGRKSEPRDASQRDSSLRVLACEPYGLVTETLRGGPEMTAITAEFQTKAMVELIERKLFARRIAFASASFTGLIAIIASVLALAA